MKITVDTSTIERSGVAAKLRLMATRLERHETVTAYHPALLRGAATLRFVAVMHDEGAADDDTGLLWCAAAHQLLTSLEAAMTDAVHESRAERRLPKPSDTPSAKRAYARTRPNVDDTMKQL